MATNNGSSEAAASGVGGWFEALTYMTGLSGGSWGTGSFMANDGILPTDLVNNVSCGSLSKELLHLMTSV